MKHKKVKTILLIVFCAFLGIRNINASTSITCDYHGTTGRLVQNFAITFTVDDVGNSTTSSVIMNVDDPIGGNSSGPTDVVGKVNVTFSVNSKADCPSSISYNGSSITSGGSIKLTNGSGSSSSVYENYNTGDYISCGNGFISDIPSKIAFITRTIYFIIEILVPIALIIIGSIDLIKGIMGSNDDEIKKGQKIFVKRLVAACIVFFVLAIVKLVVGVLGDSNKEGIMNCMDCFLNDSSSCTNMVVEMEEGSL